MFDIDNHVMLHIYKERKKPKEIYKIWKIAAWESILWQTLSRSKKDIWNVSVVFVKNFNSCRADSILSI